MTGSAGANCSWRTMPASEGGATTSAGDTKYPPEPSSSPRTRPGRRTAAPVAAASATSASTRSRAAAVCTGPMVTPSARPSPTTSAASRPASASTVSSNAVAVHVEALDRHADLPAGDEGRLDDAVGQGRVDPPRPAPGWRRRCPRARAPPGRVVAAAAAMTAWPVPTPPVKETMSTSGWPTSAAPSAASGPFTTLRTPGGSGGGHGGGHQQHRAGARRRRLDHDGVPGQQRGEDLVGHDRHGPVEGQDGGDDPVGHPLDARGRRRRGHAARAPRPPAGRRPTPCRPWWRCRRSPPGASCRAPGSAAGPGRSASTAATPASAAATTLAGTLVHGQRGPAALRPAGGGHGPVELRRRRGTARRARPRTAGPGWSPDRCPPPRPRPRRRRPGRPG